MPDRRSQNRALMMLGLVMVFWAGNSIVGRAVRFDVPPFTLAFLRWAGAFCVVLPFALPALSSDRRAIVAGWPWLVVLGLLGVGAFNALLYQGLRYTAATNALLLQAAIPSLVVLLDRVIFGTRAGLRQIIGVILSTLGVIAIVFEGDPAAAMRLHFGTGDVLILTSVVVWALYTVFLRMRPKIAPVSFIAVTFAIGVITMAPLAVMEWADGQMIRWTPVAIGSILYVALLPSLAAYFMFNSATATLGPARAGQAITLMPLFGALLSAMLLGESLHVYHFAGMALILAGIAATMLGRRHKLDAGAHRATSLEEQP